MQSREFVVARNPDPDSTLPYLIRLPLDGHDVVFKAEDVWPRTSKVYCHRADGWPTGADVVERVPVRSCARRGPAIDLVLDRGRENRSQLVITRARGREVIFWQSPRPAKQSRPNVDLPTCRAAGQLLHVLVDTAEKYPYTFSHQQDTTARRRLPAGDYAVELDDVVVASVERKSLDDLASSLLSGKLTYALAELSALPRAALVVEDRYSGLFKLDFVNGGRVAEALAEAPARLPAVPVTRAIAQEWTYRFLGAALTELSRHGASDAAADSWTTVAGPLPPSARSRLMCGAGPPPTASWCPIAVASRLAFSPPTWQPRSRRHPLTDARRTQRHAAGRALLNGSPNALPNRRSGVPPDRNLATATIRSYAASLDSESR